MKLIDLVPKFEGVRKGSSGYIARCPAHDDRQQSLSLAEGDGRILLNCFAGCTADRIVAALGLQWRDLFDKEISTPSRRSLGQSAAEYKKFDKSEGIAYFPSDARRIQAIYQYPDEQGNLLYENVRYFPKDFRQRHFDGKGTAIWNLNGVRRVPYRLPQLLRSLTPKGVTLTDVFLCEGEKDADALRELGLTASNFKGWTADFNRYILDANIVIVCDHDLPGVKQAEEAACIIKEAAKSVKVIDVFSENEFPEKHGPDISDYIRRCVQDEGLGSEEIVERLSQFAENAEEWRDLTNPKNANLFLVKTGNEWLSEAKRRPAPKMLFGEFWFEGELCILFADTNVGKSILAVQAANAISKGESFAIFGDSVDSLDASLNRESMSEPPAVAGGLTQPTDTAAARDTRIQPPTTVGGSDMLRVECPPQKVVYFDFELTSKQFESRFAERISTSVHYVNHYVFNDNFLRAEIDPQNSDIEGFATFEDFLNHSLDKTIARSGAKVLIIDNLTYLRDETENARNALPLMKYLKELKSKHQLSILALAHTPKRDSSKPLGRNDLQGSKMLINFCDSSFAIGESHKDPGLRYLKQIKARNTEIVYHAENVLLAQIRKKDNFLGFEFIGTGSEHEHLKTPGDKDKEAMLAQVKALHAEGRTQRDIATQLGISQPTVTRYLKAA